MKRILCLIITFPTISYANCDSLLKQGIFSNLNKTTYYNESSEATKAICDTYSEYKRDNNLIKASGKYKAIFKANAEYSRDRIEEINSLYCSSELANSELSDSVNIIRSYVDPNLMSTYQACVEANSYGVRMKITPSNYNTMNTVSISISSTTNPDPEITSVLFNSDKLKVTTSLGDGRLTNIPLSEQPFGLLVERIDFQESMLDEYPSKKIASSHNLSLLFQNGQSAVITFPEIWSKPNKKLEKSVGEVVSSVLNEAQFRDLYGNDWLLCNGQDAPLESRYRKFISKKLPNLNNAKMIADVKTGIIANDKNIYTENQIENKNNWKWIVSVNDLFGRRHNNDYEQAENHFVVSINNNKITSKARVYNFKHNRWGAWRSGKANFLGLQTTNSLNYYVKVD